MQKSLKNIDDYLIDDEFNEYIINPTVFLRKKWNCYFSRNLEQKEIAKKASKIILGINSFEDTTSKAEISELRLLNNFEKAYNKYKNSKSDFYFRKTTTVFKSVLAIAAIIVCVVVIYSLIERNIQNSEQVTAYTEIYVPPAKQSRVQLPDGTIVWINSATKLKYANVFNKTERVVYLSGEAYFEVLENKNIPFKVIAEEVEVKVTGTKFNVKAYSDEKIVETFLAEGRVELYTKIGSIRNKYDLNPGIKAIYDKKDNHVSFLKNNSERELAWKDGKLFIKNKPLYDVCKILQRWYDVEIEIVDQSIMEHPFTFTLKNESIEQILKCLIKAAPIEYRKEKKQFIKGKKSKQKYIISRKQ